MAQIRCIFTLPSLALKMWFPTQPPSHLAYFDWFTPFSSDLHPGKDHGFYKISRRVINGQQCSSVIPITLIRQSIHLVPAFGSMVPVEWTSSNVLDTATHFYVNSFSDRFSYSTIF